MKRATTTTRPIAETTRKGVVGSYAATIRSSANRMSHCYIPPENRQNQSPTLPVKNHRI
jgi:hypothetical protein